MAYSKTRTLSQETKDKMSKSQTGRKHTEETKQKIREAALRDGRRPPIMENIIRSDEWRKKMSVIKKGNKFATKHGLYSANPHDRILYLNMRRRVRRLGNGGTHTQGEWETLKVQYNYTCPRCHKSEPDIKLTEDHIIPLFKGGSDNIENIQPLCRSCNCSKATKIIKY